MTAAEPMGSLRFTIAGAPLERSWTSPRLRVDGREIEAPRHGDLVVPVPAGHVSLKAWTPGLDGTPFGETELSVDVAAGRTVRVWYAPPAATHLPGRLGTTPQSRAGQPFLSAISTGTVLGLTVFVVLGALVVVVVGGLLLSLAFPFFAAR